MDRAEKQICRRGEVVVGIDLGTTNSAVAAFLDGRPVIVPNSDGSAFTPSYVSYRKNGHREVGESAKTNASLYPENTVYGAKRIIGRKYSELAEPKLAKIISKWPFKIVEQGGVPVVSVAPDDKEILLSPEMIAAEILRTLKDDAECLFGVPVSKAVISVPANYNSFQRDLTKKAGTMAGLEVLHVISEPSAAALAYGIKNDGTFVGIRQMLVFDFGGGTLDISVLKAIGRTKFEIVATGGDMQLGGEDFDSVLMEYMIQRFEESNCGKLNCSGIRQNKRAMALLKQNAEEVKCHLSDTDEGYTTCIPNLFESKALRLTITRNEFEKMCTQLFDRILKPVQSIMDENPGLRECLTDVIMVGGSSNMPRVQKLLAEYFPKVPIHKDIPPEEAISHGAAIYADVLTNFTSNIELADYVHQAFGVEVDSGDMSVIIPRKSLLPTEKFTRSYCNAVDNQTAMNIRIYQGNGKMAKRCHNLGNIVVTGLPPRPKRQNSVDVTMWVDRDQILQVVTHSKDTGEKLEAQFTVIHRQQTVSNYAVPKEL